MFLQIKLINMLLIYFIGILSLSYSQINTIDKIQSTKPISLMDDIRIHDLHQYLVKNKSFFKNHLKLMTNPDYYVLLGEIIKTMDEIISYNQYQPVVNKLKLNEIGLVYEELHFVDFNQLQIQIKNQLIQNKINSTLIDKK